MFGPIVAKFQICRGFRRGCCLLIAAFLLLPSAPVKATETPFTIEALVRDKRVEGTPLAWSSSKMFLLKRDGAMIEFNPTDAKDYHKIAENFAPYSQAVLRGMLEREFGPSFEVSGTGHFLVVHPKGQQ